MSERGEATSAGDGDPAADGGGLAGVPGFVTSEVEVVEAGRLRASADRVVNLPNLLTFLRALLVPVILVLLTVDDVSANRWAFGIFLFAAATDSIDGWVARRWHGVTRWGQLADPIADKLLIIGALASLATVGDLPWWAVLVIAAREFGVTMLRIWLLRGTDVIVPASPWGKAKTISQVIAVAVYLWPTSPRGLAEGLLAAAIALTLWSGLDYAFRAGRIVRGHRDG